jgi:glycerophosphoryl diester phosphodiesterase
MEIISHRGYWKKPSEKNSTQAFEKSFSLGFGTETDVRDYNGELVISHDIPSCDSILISDFFLQYSNYQANTLALNIKSDGLVKLLTDKLSEFSITNYFVFDMSIPDSLSYLNSGVNVFLRHSEIESDMSLYNKCKGVWLDAFFSEWYDGEIIHNHLANNKKVCIVSAELHGRDNLEQWVKLKALDFIQTDQVILCTDVPEKAYKYFNK